MDGGALFGGQQPGRQVVGTSVDSGRPAAPVVCSAQGFAVSGGNGTGECSGGSFAGLRTGGAIACLSAHRTVGRWSMLGIGAGRGAVAGGGCALVVRGPACGGATELAGNLSTALGVHGPVVTVGVVTCRGVPRKRSGSTVRRESAATMEAKVAAATCQKL